MNTKIKIFSALSVFLLISFCFFRFFIHKNTDNVSVLRIENYKLTYKELEKAFTDQKFISNDSQKVSILDNYICAGLFLLDAKKLVQGKDFKESYDVKWAKDDLLIQLYNYKKYNSSINKTKLRKNYLTDNDSISILDYFWVSKTNKDIAEQINDRIINGAEIANLLGSEIFNKWIERGIRFYIKIPQNELLLTNDIQSKICKLSTGKTKILRSKSGYHIIHINGKVKKPENLDMDRAITNFGIANFIENGDTSLDNFILENNVKVNRRLLPHLNILYDKLENDTDNQIIAEVYHRKILKQDILDIIYKLKEKDQNIFQSKGMKVAAIFFILDKFFIKPILLEKERYNEKITESVVKKIKSSNVIDTIKFFEKLIENKIQNIKIPDIEGLDENNSKDNIQIKEENYSMDGFINSLDSFSDINSYSPIIKLHYTNIENLEIKTSIHQNDFILASDGKRTINNQEVLSFINQLTLESRIDMMRTDNLIKLIKVLAKNKWGSTNGLVINYSQLDRMCILETILNDNFPQFSSKDTLCSLFNSVMTIDNLRDYLAELSTELKIKFLCNITREEVLKDLMIRKYKIDLALKNKINCEYDYLRRISILENKELSKNIYERKILIKPFLLFKNVELNNKFLFALKHVNDKRLELYVMNAVKTKKIYINRKALKNLNINIKESRFSNYFIYEN